MMKIITTALIVLCSTVIFSATIAELNTFSSTSVTTKTTIAATASSAEGTEPEQKAVKEKETEKKESTAPKTITPAQQSNSKNTDGDYKKLQRGKKVLEYKYHLYA